MARLTRWCFTLNNPTEEEILNVKKLVSDVLVTYLIFGKEHFNGIGTPHLQGYIELNTQLRLSRMKKLIPRAHWEVAKGTGADNHTYVTKEDAEPFVYGERRPDQGQTGGSATKVLYEEAYQAAVDGRLEDIPKSLYIRHKRTFQEMSAESKAKRIRDSIKPPDIILTEWQKVMEDTIQQPPHDRTIYFYVDVAGGAGKSTFCRYLRIKYPFVQVIDVSSMKAADIAHAIDPEKTVFIFDVPRDGIIHAGTVEAIKNGFVGSGKYESVVKEFPVPHVYVFSNSETLSTFFSKDRPVTIYINLLDRQSGKTDN